MIRKTPVPGTVIVSKKVIYFLVTFQTAMSVTECAAAWFNF
jgi:hypothetical protein